MTCNYRWRFAYGPEDYRIVSGTVLGGCSRRVRARFRPRRIWAAPVDGVPRVEARDGVGAECRLRWYDPRRPSKPPTPRRVRPRAGRLCAAPGGRPSTALTAPSMRGAQGGPRRVVMGEPPILIDEWQRMPFVWDLVRRAVDERPDRAGSC